MKKKLFILSLTLYSIIGYGKDQPKQTDTKAAFYSAFNDLKNMLEGKDSMNYEKAVFITENAYYNNEYSFQEFQQALDIHTAFIELLQKNSRLSYEDKTKDMKIYEKKMLDLNTTNGAIFKYITDTLIVFQDSTVYYRMPFNYTTQDPYGTGDWKNTQIINMVMGEHRQGNCYSLALLFKIFSDRLKSDARLVVTPHHIYIQNRNEKGDFQNIELASRSFPKDGSIQVLTYTTKTSIMNGMAQRPLTDKEAVALNLIYLAKGFQHKYKDNTNDFLLKCADLSFKYDSLSMNALLLKAEVKENQLLQTMQTNNILDIQKARTNPSTQKLLLNYEKQLSNLYKYGYREIPKDIQHIILSAIQGNKDGYITTDKTPNPFAPIGQKQRYATLSWGLFDEIHEDVDTIQYFHALLNTKTKKIIEFTTQDSTNSYKVDPVVFALNVDPLAAKHPGISPYVFCADNPILYIDPDGRDFIVSNKADQTKITAALALVFNGSSDAFSYDKRGKLSIDQSKIHGTLSSDQNFLLGKIQGIATDQSISVKIKNVSKGGNYTEPVDRDANDNLTEAKVLINVDHPLTEAKLRDTDNGNIKDGDPNFVPSDDVKRADILIHEIGHIAEDRAGNKFGTSANDRKTVGFENYARRILGLKERMGNLHGDPGNQGKDAPTQ